MKPLVVIPARAGSKGIPNKNKKTLHGKPLIMYTIEAAMCVFSKEQICISTDDPEIIQLSKEAGLFVPFVRPAHLSDDSASSADVLLHAIEYYNSIDYFADTVILLQPTSPFRNEIHIKEALQSFNKGVEMVVSVKEAKSNPYFSLFEEDEKGYLIPCKEAAFTRRQDAPSVWEYNGGIYIVNIDAFKKFGFRGLTRIKKYQMDRVSSLDIDDEMDWKIAEIFCNEIDRMIQVKTNAE
jgi:N-acylneuraminate cytidylyltransferase